MLTKLEQSTIRNSIREFTSPQQFCSFQQVEGHCLDWNQYWIVYKQEET